MLVGDDIVAAIDLKTDRKNRKLLMQKWSWVGKGATKAPRKDANAASRKSLIVSSGFNWRSELQASQGVMILFDSSSHSFFLFEHDREASFSENRYPLFRITL